MAAHQPAPDGSHLRDEIAGAEGLTSPNCRPTLTPLPRECAALFHADAAGSQMRIKREPPMAKVDHDIVAGCILE